MDSLFLQGELIFHDRMDHCVKRLVLQLDARGLVVNLNESDARLRVQLEPRVRVGSFQRVVVVHGFF